VLPDSYIDHDIPASMYDVAGLNAEQIFARVCELMGKGAAQPTLPKRA
jgi:1-deoxy-D-xylulose-5-phosphate synthase